MDQPNRIVDIEQGVPACAVCLEPLEWVATGRCGHRALCPRCMVSVRVARNKRLCVVCGAWCPYVVVTRAAAAWDASLLSRMPLTMREGHHGSGSGSYWYSRRTGAYFDDSQQYYAVSRAAAKIPLPFYQPTVMFLLAYALCFLRGGVLGNAYARGARHTWSKVMAYVVCILVCLFFVSFLWFAPRYCSDEDEPSKTSLLGAYVDKFHQYYAVYPAQPA